FFNFFKNFFVLDLLVSDHLPILVQTSFNSSPEILHDPVPNFAKADWPSYQEALNDFAVNPPPFPSSMYDIDEYNSSLVSAITSVSDRYIPFKHPYSQRWDLPPHIKNLLSTKKALLRFYKRTKCPTTLLRIRQLSKDIRHQIQNSMLANIAA